jgi:hypothetical protein
MSKHPSPGPTAAADRAARTRPPRVPEVGLRVTGSLSRVAEERWIEPGRTVVVEERLSEEELWRQEGADHSGWYCVRTNPFPCPAEGCVFVAGFMTAVHLILVWEQRDDPNLLHHAQRAKEVGRNPRIEAYEPAFGPSASYYAWEAAGGPVHGVRAL